MRQFNLNQGTIALLISVCFSLWASVINNARASDIPSLASQLGVHYQVLDTVSSARCEVAGIDAPCFSAEITLSLPDTLPEKNWYIVFSHLSPVLAADADAFSVEHINGDVHMLTVSQDVEGGATLHGVIHAAGWHVSRSDIIPNWFVVAEGEKAALITATAGKPHATLNIDVAPHAGTWNTAQQYQRGKNDELPLADSAWLYQHYSDIQAPADHQPEIRPIPQVNSLKVAGERFPARAGIALPLATSHPARAVFRDAGVPVSEQGVAVTLENFSQAEHESQRAYGSYSLKVSPEYIEIKAADSAGQDYALMTLAQLYDPAQKSFAQVSIEDSPAYSYRGMHLDIARNFQGKDSIRNLLEQMYRFKLNKLHLHLADDEGWRLAINALPALTDIGAWRCSEVSEQSCLLPTFGSGPMRDSPVNGFLSQNEFVELLKYAAARHIDIIPSIDMPGHSRAAIKSLQAAEGQLQLTEQADKTHYRSIQNYNDNTLNPCIVPTYEFAGIIMDELKRLYKQAGVPLEWFHMGADETAGAWTQSPACKAHLGRNLNEDDGHALLGEFVARIQTMAAERGLKLAGWSDGLSQLPDKRKDENLLVTFWHTLNAGGAGEVNAWLQSGTQVVLSLPDVLYFDFPYRNHPEEPGFYWASKDTDTFKVFQFTPQLLPLHQHFWNDRMGQRYTQSAKVASKPVYGIQGQVWTEVIRSPSTLEYMIYPRLFALAERAWHAPEWLEGGRQLLAGNPKSHARVSLAQRNAFHDFSAQLVAYALPQLSQQGLNFRLPPPGITMDNDTTLLNAPFPGLTFQGLNNAGDWETVVPNIKLSEYSQFRTTLRGSNVVSPVSNVKTSATRGLK